MVLLARILWYSFGDLRLRSVVAILGAIAAVLVVSVAARELVKMTHRSGYEWIWLAAGPLALAAWIVASVLLGLWPFS